MGNVTLNRQDLYNMVWAEPMLLIAKRYNVSDYVLRKICIKLEIPLPGAGHWQKVRMGKQIKVPQLPTTYSGEHEITLISSAAGSETEKSNQSPLSLLQQEIEQELEDLLHVSSRLTNPDRLITAVKDDVESKNRKYNYKDLVPSSLGTIEVNVSISMLGRALCFMDTLIKCLRARNHKLQVVDRDTYAMVNGERIQVSLREKLNRAIVKEKPWDSAIYSPSGTLIFQIEKGYRSKEWKDGKQPLESKIATIVATLEQKAKETKAQRIASEKAAEERRERQRAQVELEQRQEKELTRFKQLMQQAKQWCEAQMLRDYIKGVKQQAIDAGTLTEEIRQWIEWAMQKTEWYDPLIKRKDELLNDVDKDSLTLRKRSSAFY